MISLKRIGAHPDVTRRVRRTCETRANPRQAPVRVRTYVCEMLAKYLMPRRTQNISRISAFR